MASSKKSTASRRQRTDGRHRTDAIAVLKADHRQVEEWFSQFENSNKVRKQQLVDRICDALTVHITLEEEIFYPSFLDATDDKQTHHEAKVEHAMQGKLIEEIRGMSAADDYFHANVTVLSALIKHHVKDKQRPDGMFTKARRSRMDLRALGEEIVARKKQLQARKKRQQALSRAAQGAPAMAAMKNASTAMDLEPGVFKPRSARATAQSLND